MTIRFVLSITITLLFPLWLWAMAGALILLAATTTGREAAITATLGHWLGNPSVQERKRLVPLRATQKAALSPTLPSLQHQRRPSPTTATFTVAGLMRTGIARIPARKC